MFDAPVTKLIIRRTSWRTFNGESLTDTHREQLQSFIDSRVPTPFGSKPSLYIIDNDENGKLGTYGIIKGAKQYLAGTADNAAMGVEDYGYVLEAAILYATQLGLGTCWLGGFFNRTAFHSKLNTKDHIPAVTPLGYPRDRRTTARVIRWAAGSKNRKPWRELFFNKNKKHLSETEAGEYTTALEMLRLAPSASNKQPWRVFLENDRLHLHCHTRTGYSLMDRLDMGIAMSHLELTLADQGINGNWSNDSQHIDSDHIYVATWTKSNSTPTI